MILHNTTYDGVQRFTIAAFDRHREYCIDPDPTFSIHESWDPYNISDAMNFELADYRRGNGQGGDTTDDRLTEAYKLLYHDSPISAADWYDEAAISGTILILSGTIQGLTKLYFRYLSALDDNISGDDTVFDYWPNTMIMLTELARDLDLASGGDLIYYDWLQRTYDKVAARFIATQRVTDEEWPTLGDGLDWFADEVLPRP